jgi:hypothetical protein
MENDRTNNRMNIFVKIFFLFLLLTGIISSAAGAQSQQFTGIAWTKTYPDCDSCEFHAIAQTTDGGYLVTGISKSNQDLHDMLLLKTDNAGNKLWSSTGNGNSCEGNAVMAIAPDNAAILGGGCGTRSGTITLNMIENTKGTIQKSWNFEAGGHATGTSLISTGDGGYLILAEGDTRVAGRSDQDLMISRVDSGGTILWTKIFSGTLTDTAKSEIMAPDGGFIIAGSTVNPSSNKEEILVLKLDAKGTEQWVNTIGTENDETAQSIASTGDGGYLIAGTSCRRGRSGDCDIHAVRINAAGTTVWDRKYGGISRDSASVVLASPHGGYTIAGTSDSPDLGAMDQDIHIVHLDNNGSEEWNSTFGTSSYEIVTGAVIATDGSLVVSGYATDPVDTKKRTPFITSIGREGRDPPPELLHSAVLPRKNTGIEVRVRNEKTGAGIAGAEVYYDGKMAGKTSETDGIYVIEKNTTGSHSVRVVKPGYRETTVITSANTGSSLNIQLQPSAITQIAGSESHEAVLDIVFVPSGTSYDCQQQKIIPADPYIDHPETFVNDTRRLSELTLFQLGKYSSDPTKIPLDYRKELNIYYYWDGERYADAFKGCAGTLPDGFWDEAPFTDIAIIIYPKYYGPNKGSPCEPIGCTNGMGPGTHTWFKAPANNAPVFLHESGHAIFGLMDTYCGDTYYTENDPFPNIWLSAKNCKDATTKNGGSDSACRQITGGVTGSKSTCEKEYWKYDRDVDLMAVTSLSATFGESSTQRIQYIFNKVAGRI